MGALKDLAKSFSRLTQEEVELFCMEYGIGTKFKPTAPACDALIDKCPVGFVALYCRHFDFSNLRYPFSLFIRRAWLGFYILRFCAVLSDMILRYCFFAVFFRLAKNGDWFTFETSKVDSCLISSMVTTLGTWKNRFFWVSDTILPFKMVWRHPDAVLNEPEPLESDLNDAFLKAIRECPSRVHPFPEHLLVLLGVSKLWEKANRDPVLMRDGTVMSALDFIKSDDTSDVVFGDVPVIPGENVTRRSTRRLKGVPQSTSTEPVELSDDVEVSGDQGVEAGSEKERKLVVHGKKGSAKKVVATPVQGSSSMDLEGLDLDAIYVPGWSVKIDDSFKDAAVCEDALSHIDPPSVHNTISEMDDDVMLSRMILSTCNLAAMLPQGVARFLQRMQEYEEFSKKKDKMKSSMAAMKKEISGFAEKEEAWSKKVEGLSKQHEIEMSDFKKSFEADRLKLKADKEALSVAQKAFDEEKESLKALVSRATSDNQWLIEQGYQQVVTYLLHSAEFNSALGEVYTKLLNLGKHQGLIAGYKLHEAGHPLEKSPLFRPEASDVFKGLVEQMERLTYPYVHQVSSCFGKPLSVLRDLKPEGLNEKVCAEVLGSLSKKRPYSGDSDDTLSSVSDVSKDASLEASAVGGDGGAKAKNSKKAKKAKAEGSGVSKPSAAVG
ncbi:hypothetical protein HanPSC8_Chr14g0623151 [Helianthus annuus]|nr:hypothetical protein HanPSC8_Chr14g0623151 [Helianthus annuus]